jgi:FkbM family methyltransferase
MSQALAVVDFNTKQKTSYCIDLDTRDRQIAENCARIKGRIEARPDRSDRIAVVCYGPSLEDTWEQLREFEYIITCSGAHKFLIDRGIVPTWHAEVDPRPHKADLIGAPHRDVEYLIASVCHKAVLDLLEGYKVKLWHVYSHESERAIPIAYARGEWCLTGGTNVGLRSLVLARFLGFRKITLFGMDYSFKVDGTQHAGWHPKEIPNIYAVPVSGEVFYTNPPMHQYAQSFFKEINKLGDIELDVVGTGLLQAQIREHLKTKPLIENREPSMIAAASPAIASPEYLEQNRALHQQNPAYGISGSKRADVVKKLIESTKPATVLDYGCGKGTLAAALPFPIWEYDPAIPGKDAPPRPAELVVCTDVLEHIEPDYLDSVLMDLARCTIKVCYAVIHTGPAAKTLPDGRNAHLIQQKKAWWKAALSKYFAVASLDERGVELVAVLGPKPKQKENNVIAPALDFSKRITPVRKELTEARFYTPNENTHWRARSLIDKEPATIAWIDTFAAGEVLYDIGANVGGYTCWAARRRGVKVVAFEPEAGNYAMLCRNMELNGVEGVAYPLALTDQTRLSEIFLASREVGSSCNSFGEPVGFDLKARDGIRQGAVGMPLDAVVQMLKSQGDLFLAAPKHIKIDVDGFEYKVVRGMADLLASGTLKSLLVEVNANLPEHRDMLDFLASFGYTHDPAQFEAAQRKDGAFKGCGECVFTKCDPVEKAVLDKLANAEMRTFPFPHLYVEDVFPEPITQLPDNAAYQSLMDARGTPGYPQRYVAKAPPSLAWMNNGKLRALLDKRFGVKSRSDETLLLRDFAGYEIGPHTDTPAKGITALFYITPDWTEAEHGTTLYQPINKQFTDPKGKHHKLDGFTEVWTAPGKPNSVLIFARTDKSFHGCKRYQGQFRHRDILLWDSKK